VTKVRTKNMSARETCDWCDETGFVIASIRQERSARLVDGEIIEQVVEHEEMGPCPHCERGFAVEFPNAKRFEGSGRPAGIEPPWDREEGFWKGRSTGDIRPMVERGQAPKADEGEGAA